MPQDLGELTRGYNPLSDRTLLSLSDVIQRISRLSADDTPWGPLREVLPGLRERATWLEEQWTLIPAPLVVVLYGGTGTGKSTLLNALAGAAIAETGVRRPTTETPTVYHPPTAHRDFGPAAYVESAGLDGLVLIDTPDTDSVCAEHCARVAELLHQADVVLFCGTLQKYADDKSIALLKPLRDERKVVCIQTRADEDPDVREDWMNRLRHEGFPVDYCFRVSAARALDRKLSQRAPAETEFEFGLLEDYIRDKLPPQRAEIKERNLRGAVANTLDDLVHRLSGRRTELEALDGRLEGIESEIARASLAAIQQRLLDEPHVWVVALAAAVSERAFGVVGTSYRVLHWVRMLPGRIAGALSPAALLRPAADSLTPLLRSGETVDAIAPMEAPEKAFLHGLAETFGKEHAEAGAYLARNGFSQTAFDVWKEDFVAELRPQLEAYLLPVQQRLHRRAQRLARWLLPVLELLWALLFMVSIGSPVAMYCWNLARHAQVVLPEPGFLPQSVAMIAVVIVIEILLFACVVRWAGHGLRGRCAREIKKGLGSGGFGFTKPRAEVRTALSVLDTINGLRGSVTGNR